MTQNKHHALSILNDSIKSNTITYEAINLIFIIAIKSNSKNKNCVRSQKAKSIFTRKTRQNRISTEREKERQEK